MALGADLTAWTRTWKLKAKDNRFDKADHACERKDRRSSGTWTTILGLEPPAHAGA